MTIDKRLITVSLFTLAFACGRKESDTCMDCAPAFQEGQKTVAAEGNALPGPAADAAAPSPGSASPAAPARPIPSVGTVKETSKVIVDKTGSGEEQLTSLTAAAYNDALNLDAFLAYTKTGARIKLPEQSPFSYELSKEDLQKIVPIKDAKAAKGLDISLVLDVTGSMSDELRYLQNEWKDIIANLKIQLPDLDLRYSLIVYRDTVDIFVTKSLDFTGDVNAFQAELAKYSAGGGGDRPEAVDAAFLESNKLSWSDEADRKKLLFWVADAPAHEADEDKAMADMLKLKEKAVTIYPIAASGVDDKTEMTMRLAALLSGGEYIFLTDDSGVGDKHAKPHIPCYQVERLNQLLTRILSREATGKNEEIKKENIIRTVGKPNQGVCEVTDESPSDE